MLVVHHLSKSYGIEPVLFDVSFTLNVGEKAALVGPNGCGKSTLLRILADEESPDRGSVHINPPNLSRAYLPQGGGFLSGETVGDFIRRAEGNQADLTNRLESLAAKIVHDPGNIQLQQVYDDTLIQLENAVSTGSSAAILSSFRLDNLPPDLPLQALSGGQKTRLGLAGILLSNPRLLLLDEPTNHLDFDMLDWLEGWLKNSKCAVLLVSHDRDFLDHVAGIIFELDPSTHQLTPYAGNYRDYLEQKETELARQWQDYNNQQAQIRELTQAARHVRNLATFTKNGKADTGDKFARGFFANRGLATVKRAKSIESRIEILLNEDRVEKPRAALQMKMDFGKVFESGRGVLIMEGLSIGYQKTIVLQDIHLVLRYGERAALVGPNGCGKTTLLRTIMGEIPPLAGNCRLGASVNPGYLTQEQEYITPGFTALSFFQQKVSLNETESRAFLHKYLFSGDEVFTPVESLSFGQRARLSMACLVAQGSNLLLLDEPLNHLDIASRSQFEKSLSTFEGSILTVVHDRYFLKKYANRLLKINEDGLVQDWDC